MYKLIVDYNTNNKYSCYKCNNKFGIGDLFAHLSNKNKNEYYHLNCFQTSSIKYIFQPEYPNLIPRSEMDKTMIDNFYNIVKNQWNIYYERDDNPLKPYIDKEIEKRRKQDILNILNSSSVQNSSQLNPSQLNSSQHNPSESNLIEEIQLEENLLVNIQIDNQLEENQIEDNQMEDVQSENSSLEIIYEDLEINQNNPTTSNIESKISHIESKLSINVWNHILEYLYYVDIVPLTLLNKRMDPILNNEYIWEYFLKDTYSEGEYSSKIPLAKQYIQERCGFICNRLVFQSLYMEFCAICQEYRKKDSLYVKSLKKTFCKKCFEKMKLHSAQEITNRYPATLSEIKKIPGIITSYKANKPVYSYVDYFTSQQIVNNRIEKISKMIFGNKSTQYIDFNVLQYDKNIEFQVRDYVELGRRIEKAELPIKIFVEKIKTKIKRMKELKKYIDQEIKLPIHNKLIQPQTIQKILEEENNKKRKAQEELVRIRTKVAKYALYNLDG